MEIPSGISLTNEEMWKLGFSQLFILLGFILAVSAVAAWKGSEKAFKVCCWWAALYSVVIGGVVIWHFPDTMLVTVGLGIIWSVVWFYWVRIGHVKNSV